MAVWTQCGLCFRIWVYGLNVDCVLGYGFVDFESTDAAEMAVKALQSRGIQAQMAKVHGSYVLYVASKWGTYRTTR